MAKQRTEKSTYTSPSTGEHCTPAQYFAEIMVTREAKQANFELSYKFWNHKPWNAKYRYQVGLAYKLLKEYPHEAITKAIRSLKWAYSLRTKKLLKEIQTQSQIITQQTANTELDTQDVNIIPQRTNNKSSRLSKLK